jgi:hypothetical protein
MRSSEALPHGVASLYAKACQVLVTLRAPGGYDDPIGIDTLRLLSFLAFAMFERQLQSVRRGDLLQLLDEARRQLGAKMSSSLASDEWIRRFEDYGALLTYVGYEDTLEGPERVYEFRHLQFQEFLTARAWAFDLYPGFDVHVSLAERIAVHMHDLRWSHPITLTLLLVGQKASALLAEIVSRSEDIGPLILGCLTSDVKLTEEVATQCLQQLMSATAAQCRGSARTYDIQRLETLARGSYGAQFLELSRQHILAPGPARHQNLQVLAFAAAWDWFQGTPHAMTDQVAEALRKELKSSDRNVAFRATLVCMYVAGLYRAGHRAGGPMARVMRSFSSLFNPLANLVGSSDPPLAYAACGALAVLGARRSGPSTRRAVLRLYQLWRRLGTGEHAAYPSWALALLPLMTRSNISSASWAEADREIEQADGTPVTPLMPLDAFLRSNAEPGRPDHMRQAALVMGYYRRTPWSRAELMAMARSMTMRTAFPGEGTVKRVIGALEGETEHSLKQEAALDLLDAAERWLRRVHQHTKQLAAMPDGPDPRVDADAVLGTLTAAWDDAFGLVQPDAPAVEKLRTLVFACLTCDLALGEETTARALRILMQSSSRQCRMDGQVYDAALLDKIASGRHGKQFIGIARELYLSESSAGHLCLQALGLAAAREWFDEHRARPQGVSNDASLSDTYAMTYSVAMALRRDLRSSDSALRIRAVLTCLHLASLYTPANRVRNHAWAAVSANFQDLLNPLAACIAAPDMRLVWSACGALAVFGMNRVFGRSSPLAVLNLYRCWRQHDGTALAPCPAWALALLPVLPGRRNIQAVVWEATDRQLRNAGVGSSAAGGPEVSPFDEFIRRNSEDGKSLHCRQAALAIAFYRRAPWSNPGLIEKLSVIAKNKYRAGMVNIARMLRVLREEAADADAL